MTTGEIQVTCSAPVNIAVIKYWGKRNTSLILPTNSSLSVTLDQDHLRSTTTAAVDFESSQDVFWLNGKKIEMNNRFITVISEAKKLRQHLELQQPDLPKLSQAGLTIASVNNFPTAAGLASSASGFACLTYTLFQLYQLPLSLSEVSRLARMGSGSACRSLFGGFVAWEMGELEDGTDSVAVQVAPEAHWPDMEALILVVSDSQKETGSTIGMQSTVLTSPLLQERIKIVPERMRQMIQAIHDKDFDLFAELTMADSNQFHSVCLDTFPPVFYMNDISRAIIRLVNLYNGLFLDDTTPGFGKKGYRAAYTYDAGPNAVIYLRKEHVPELLALVRHFFPAVESPEYFGRAAEFLVDDSPILQKAASISMTPLAKGSLSRIISTRVGSGPQVLARGFDPNVSLINQDKEPINLK